MVTEFTPQSPEHLLPPQNIEAEESILGGILLDPEAMNRVVDLLKPECFSIASHKLIYDAAKTLHLQGKPTDLMTLTTWLQDHNLLEQVGGQAKLAQLVDRTVSAVNIDRYAALVVDKYLRRELISAGHSVVDLGFDTTLELDSVLDQVEQKIFNLTQKRPQQGFIKISDTLVDTFDEIQNLHQGIKLPGIPCGFADLDAITSGFQRSDLIILAGRPSMGKTALGLGIAANIAKEHQLPVAIFSLEMSKEQLAQRLVASESKIEGNRIRSGRLSQTDLTHIVGAINTLSELPIFIDDTPNSSVMEMRSQARRLQAERGGNLGLILLDYLQLMEGSGSDNRVQELSRITRSLKGLARELNVPVIALSQLSRGVEQRNNKRPMLSDLRESGCLSGDSLIPLADEGISVPIRDLIGKSGFAVWAVNERTMKLERAIVSNAFSTGVKPTFRLKTRLGRTIWATGNHLFLTLAGWKRLDELQSCDRIALPRYVPSLSSQTISNAELALHGITKYKQNISRERCARLADVVKLEEIFSLAHSDIYWDEIVSIEAEGETEVYDLTVPKFHNFVANNIVVHNSIEQDADVVIMLYRDSYYNPDTNDRNMAEVIIAKHRNGPTGMVKLHFNAELTKFDNLAYR